MFESPSRGTVISIQVPPEISLINLTYIFNSHDETADERYFFLYLSSRENPFDLNSLVFLSHQTKQTLSFTRNSLAIDKNY